MTTEAPPPSPEGELIRRAREAYVPRLSVRAAAARVGMSTEYWGYVERGYQPRHRGIGPKPVTPSAQALAQMAFAVEVTPDELRQVDRGDAAEVLEEIIRRQKAREAPERRTSEKDIVRKMAEFFEDDQVSPDEKRIMAERFFRILPYYIAGQTPPRNLLDDDNESPANGGSGKSA